MGVPPGFSLAVESSHCPIAGKEILNGPRQAMSWMGHSVSSRGPFKEDEVFGATPLLQRLVVNLRFFPELKYLFFQLRKGRIARYLWKHVSPIRLLAVRITDSVLLHRQYRSCPRKRLSVGRFVVGLIRTTRGPPSWLAKRVIAGKIDAIAVKIVTEIVFIGIIIFV